MFPVGLDAEVLIKNRALTEDFTKLYLELESEGFFRPCYIHIILRTIELILMGFVGWGFLQCPNYVTKCVGVFLIGLTQGRSGWLQHETGHNSFCGYPMLDRFFHVIFFGKR